MPTILILILLALSFLAWKYWKKRQLRRELLSSRLSDGAFEIVCAEVPLFQRLPEELQTSVEGKINLFLDQVEFLGFEGLEVTEEMELSIAAQACILIANKDTWYRNLRTILVYPSAFKSRQQSREGYVVKERETVRLGESWARGPVILSWQHSQEGASDDRDGHNVVLHEFAHQLDDLSGRTDGAPTLAKGQNPKDWDAAFDQAFTKLVNDTLHGRDTFLDGYGATNPQEFFAVAVESFFEKPVEMKQREAAVYKEMSKFFELDPAGWF